MSKEDKGQRLEYKIVDAGHVRAGDVLAAAEKAWGDLKRPNTLDHKAAVDAGIDLDALPATLEEALSIEQTAAGFDAVTLSVIVVALAPAANRAALDMWKYVILPHIRRRWGDHAIKANDDKQKAAAKASTAAKNPAGKK